MILNVDEEQKSSVLDDRNYFLSITPVVGMECFSVAEENEGVPVPAWKFMDCPPDGDSCFMNDRNFDAAASDIIADEWRKLENFVDDFVTFSHKEDCSID